MKDSCGFFFRLVLSLSFLPSFLLIRNTRYHQSHHKNKTRHPHRDMPVDAQIISLQHETTRCLFYCSRERERVRHTHHSLFFFLNSCPTLFVPDTFPFRAGKCRHWQRSCLLTGNLTGKLWQRSCLLTVTGNKVVFSLTTYCLLTGNKKKLTALTVCVF